MVLSEEHIKSGSLHRNIVSVTRGAISPGYSPVHFNTCEGRACGRGRDFSCAYWQSEAVLGEMRWKREINQSWREERGGSTFFAIIFIYLEFYFEWGTYNLQSPEWKFSVCLLNPILHHTWHFLTLESTSDYIVYLLKLRPAGPESLDTCFRLLLMETWMNWNALKIRTLIVRPPPNTNISHIERA